MNKLLKIEMTWYWSLSCLHVTCITRFWKVFSIFPVWSANGHMLWVKILFLIRSVMSKLIAKKQLFTKVDPKSDDNILKIEPLDEKASLIDVETKIKVLFSGNLNGDELEEKFWKECHRISNTLQLAGFQILLWLLLRFVKFLSLFVL